MPNDPEEKNLWIDLTDLLAWQGHYSGIQRVVHSYASRYHSHGARYFICRRLSGRFIEVEWEHYFSISDDEDSRNVRLPLKLRLKNSYRRLLPRRIRRHVTPVIRKGLHYVLAAAALVYYVVPKSDPFAASDKVLVLGAGWEAKRLIHELARVKKKKSLKVVHLWHDLLPISHPQLFDKKLSARQLGYTAKALRVSDGTVSVSKATEKDVYDFAAKSNLTIGEHTVIREGEDSYKHSKAKRPASLPEHIDKFIFSLGTLEIRKNHQLLYQAYKLAQQKGVDLPALVIVGRPGWLAHDFLAVLRRDETIKDKIFMLRSLPDAEVLWLLENCLFTIYPSLCEGWGLTISDSLGHGKLCLTGNISSMPEVAGDMADYFSPYNSGECLKLIRQYAESSEKLAAKEALIKNYTPYSWDASFKQLKAFVDSV